jgi:hypothetical protein
MAILAWRTSSYSENGANCVEVAINWRKSSYSGNGANCVEVAINWRKSSYSGNGANCVEVAPAAVGVLLRDTKDKGAGPFIAFTSEQWTAFLAEVITEASSSNGAVEVIHTGDGTQVHEVASGVWLRFTPSEWAAFRAGVRDGEFGLLALA